MPFFIQLIASVVLMIAGYLLMPKPKFEATAQDFDAPDARADKPMPIVFGTKKIKDVNCLFAADKTTRKRKA